MIRILLFLIFSFLALYAAAESLYLNSARGFYPLLPGHPLQAVFTNKSVSPRSYTFDFNDPYSRLQLALRYRNINASADYAYPVEQSDGSLRKIKNPYWGFMIISASDTLFFRLAPHLEENILGSSKTVQHLEITQNNIPLLSQYIKKNYSPHGKNLILLSRTDQHWNISLGDGADLNSFSFSTDSFGKSAEFRILLGPAASLEVSSLSMVSEPDYDMSSWINLDEIHSMLTDPDDALTGIWELYDYDIRPELLTITPHLRFALLPGDDGYSLYYLKGYPNNPLWKPGMKKLELKESSFKDIYDVVWIDAAGKAMKNGITASLEYPVINLFFTPQDSKIRLRKVNDKFTDRLLYE